MTKRRKLELAVKATPQETEIAALRATLQIEKRQSGELLSTLALMVWLRGGSVVVTPTEWAQFAELDWALQAGDIEEGYEIKLVMKPQEEKRNGQASGFDKPEGG